MTQREFDLLVIGFSVGALVFLWVGYRLRVRVERWGSRRKVPTHRDAKHVPFGDLSERDAGNPLRQQRAQRILQSRSRVIPLAKRSATAIPTVADDIPSIADHAAREWTPAETAKAIRADAVAALTGAGFKRAEAERALDDCTLAERAGGIDSWVQSALRRAVSKQS